MGDPKMIIPTTKGIFIHQIKKNKRNMVAYEIFLRGLMFILEQN